MFRNAQELMIHFDEIQVLELIVLCNS